MGMRKSELDSNSSELGSSSYARWEKDGSQALPDSALQIRLIMNSAQICAWHGAPIQSGCLCVCDARAQFPIVDVASNHVMKTRIVGPIPTPRFRGICFLH